MTDAGIEVPVAKKGETQPHMTFELSEHLPYLFKHIHSQLDVASSGKLAEYGVNVAVWRILAVLWEHDNLSNRELAHLTSIEVSTLSRVSKTVQRDGLIRRKRTMEDQRTVRVTLTDKGKALVQAIMPAALELQRELVDELSPDDVATLTRLLHRVVENLNKYAEADVDLIDDAPPAPAAAAARPRTPAKPSPKTRSARTLPAVVRSKERES